MLRTRIGQGVLVDVPATTANLGPGFDCLGAALALSNRFELRVIDGGPERFELIIEGPEGSHLRGGPDNLVYRSAQRVWREAGEEPVALEARVQLAVPPARGLGSSATSIVAGLTVNRYDDRSPDRANENGCEAGCTVHPAGTLTVT